MLGALQVIVGAEIGAETVEHSPEPLWVYLKS